MDSSRRSSNDTSPARRGPQLIYSRERGFEHPVQSPSGNAAQTAVILGLCLFGPELANLSTNDQTAWTIYLTAKEAANATFCLYLAWILKERASRWICFATSLVFATQAMDEAFGTNIIQGHRYEYPVEGAFLLAVWYLAKLFPGEHERSE